MLRRRALRCATVFGLVVLCGLAVAPASAHPLGNATVNHYDGLELHPDKVVDHAVEDVAEIPTLQRKSRIDTNGDSSLSPSEMSDYAAAQCDEMAATVRVTVDGARVAFRVLSSSYEERPGQVGLASSRLECELEGPARIDREAEVAVENTWDDDGIGWHEITAVGVGVVLQDSPFPAESISDALRAYPDDLLSSPLDVRRGTVTVRPGEGRSTYEAVKDLPVAGPVARALDDLSRTFNEKVGADNLTVGVGLLALLLSLALGAGHAFLPGHGKTIMAAYLVGRGGTLRDVVTVGATVTITHTAGVLLLGLAVTTTTAFAPATAERYLGVISGVIVAAVGLGLLVTALRRRKRPAHSHDHHEHHDHDAHDAHDAHDDHGHRHTGHGHGHGHDHGPHGHSHGFGRGGLVGLGVAGGLVPSPSALLVLLAATALGRTWFGVALVLGYGVGMALALTLAGLLLVKLRSRLDRWTGSKGFARAGRVAAVLPVLTALLVLAVGTGLALRAAGGSV